MKNLNIMIPDELHTKLKLNAAKEKKLMKQYIPEILEAALTL